MPRSGTRAYGEFRINGALVGLIQIGRFPGYPHVIHEGQVFVRRGTLINIAGHAELRRMFDGAAPYVVATDTEDFIALLQSLRDGGWHSAFIPHQRVDERLDGSWTSVSWPGTRRRINRPADFAGTNPQYLMKRPESGRSS